MSNALSVGHTLSAATATCGACTAPTSGWRSRATWAPWRSMGASWRFAGNLGLHLAQYEGMCVAVVHWSYGCAESRARRGLASYLCF